MIDGVAYIALGSNMANPFGQVCEAIEEISQLKQSRLLASSKIYKSAPMETVDDIQQDDYTNAVILIETQLDPFVLLTELKTIEKKHKRLKKGPRWGPRTLDLDILLYGDRMISTADLTLPHPGIAERNFVLVPLMDIDPNLMIPGVGVVSDLIKKCKNLPLEQIERISNTVV